MINRFIFPFLLSFIATLAMDLNKPLITSSGSVVIGETKMALENLTLNELEILKITLSQSSQSKNPKIVRSLTQIKHLIKTKKHLALREQQSREIERARLEPQLQTARRIALCVNAMLDKKPLPDQEICEQPYVLPTGTIRKRSKSYEPPRPKIEKLPLREIKPQKTKSPRGPKSPRFFFSRRKKTK